MRTTRTFCIVAATGLAYLLSRPFWRIARRVRRARAELRRREWDRKRDEADELANRLLGVG